VNFWTAGLTIAGVVAAALTMSFLMRRRAPVGGVFSDADRAAGVFGVLGTSFAVVLAFVIFLAFESYGTAKDKAGQEAIAVSELFHEARLFSPSTAHDVRGQLVCYARAVISDEWPAMRRHGESALVEGWLTRLSTSVDGASISGDKQSIEYRHWLDQASERLDGRRGRLAEATPFVPRPLWVVLFVGALLLIAYTCVYADPGEKAWVQAMMVTSITVIVVLGLLSVRFLDSPYENRSGSIKPTEMSRTLRLMDDAQRIAATPTPAPCDSTGRPAPG